MEAFPLVDRVALGGVVLAGDFAAPRRDLVVLPEKPKTGVKFQRNSTQYKQLNFFQYENNADVRARINVVATEANNFGL